MELPIYIKTLEKTGVSRKQAEAHVQINFEYMEKRMQELATKKDVGFLHNRMDKFELSIKQEIDGLRLHIEGSINDLRLHTGSSINNLRLHIGSLELNILHVRKDIERIEKRLGDQEKNMGNLEKKMDECFKDVNLKFETFEDRIFARLRKTIINLTLVIAAVVSIPVGVVSLLVYW